MKKTRNLGVIKKRWRKDCLSPRFNKGRISRGINGCQEPPGKSGT